MTVLPIFLPLIALGAAHGATAPASLPQTSPLRVVASANRQAIEQPVAQGFVNAIQVYAYSEGAIFQAYAAPGSVTDIALQPGEALVAVASGDTARWLIGDTVSGGSGDNNAKQVHVLVKPFAPGLSTNLVITTDRRTYHLRLSSTAATAMAGIRWAYPADAMLALEAKAQEATRQAPVARELDLQKLRFDYVISGDRAPWRPVRAFDDGRQTYIEFPPSLAQGEAPPLFVLGPDGKAELVNYRVHERYYVVDRLFETAELRLGLHKQQIVRISRDDGAKRRRGA